MKTSVCLFIIIIELIKMSSALAQPVINSFYGGEPGDLITFIECDSTYIQPGPSGAYVNWDFSNLNQISTRYEMVISPETAPFYDQFPGTNYCRNVYPAPVFFSFYTVNNEALSYYGFSTWTSYLSYTDGLKLLKFPFTFEDSFLDTFLVNYATFQEKSFYTHHADAYGTLNLPDNSYENVLRIKTSAITTDSNFNTGNIQTTLLTEYNYYGQGIVGSLLTISERVDETGPIFKIVFYNYDPIIHIHENKSYAISIYPNPTSNNVFIVKTNDQTKISSIALLDLSGKEILQQQECTQDLININLMTCPSGVYLLKILVNKEAVYKKLIIH